MRLAGRVHRTFLAHSAMAVVSLVTSPMTTAITAQEAEQSDEVFENLTDRELTILYTKTNLSLAELELKRALELNLGRHIIPPLTIERLRSNLAVAKEQYRQASAESGHASENVRLRHASERVRIAKVDLAAAEKLKDKGAVSEFELRRLQLKFDLARLNLALMQHPQGYLTLVDNMQRQIDRLGDEFLAMEQRIEKLEAR